MFNYTYTLRECIVVARRRRRRRRFVLHTKHVGEENYFIGFNYRIFTSPTSKIYLLIFIHPGKKLRRTSKKATPAPLISHLPVSQNEVNNWPARAKPVEKLGVSC